MRIFVIFLLVLVFTFHTAAQNYTRDVGIRAGYLVSASYRQYNNDDSYFEMMAGFNYHTLGFTVLKEFSKPAFIEFSPNLQFLYGYGIHAGITRKNKYEVFTRTYYYDDYRISPVFGVDGYIGLEYWFPEIPFIVGIDFKPYFEFSTIQYFNLNLFDSALTLKFKF